MAPPSRTSSTAAYAAAVALLGPIAVGAPGMWPLVPGIALLVIARATDGADVRLAALCWGAVAICMAASFGLVWPIPPALGLGAAATAWHFSGRRDPIRWLGPSVADRPAAVLALISLPLTVTALVAFIVSGRTDIDTATEGIQGLPVWLILLAGLGFALVNPTVEEVLFRGVLQTAMATAWGSPSLAIAAQAAAFGAIHLRGVPGGPLGMAMAAVWGAALGVIRHRTQSIRIPWLVHVIANLAIFTSIVALGYRDGIL